MYRRDLLSALLAAPAVAAPLPADALYASDPEQYWLRMRRDQFYLPEWRVYMNNGSLGVAPKPVVERVAAYLEEGATLAEHVYPRWGYETMDAHRDALASFTGCAKDDLALTHNATEAISTVAAGLDLRAGDEVLMTDQEHTSGKGPWLMRQARQGISVREVTIPLPPRNAGELADRMISAIGPRTRILSFSGILTTTGLVMPVREICRAARDKGVLTLVDGAHMHGQIGFRIADMECDFMAGSPHKWLFAPPGCGLLYIREEMQRRLWPSIADEAWKDYSLKAARFMQVGTNNRAVMEGMVAGLRFSKTIGPERILHRIHELSRKSLQRARAMPELQILTPEDDSLYAGMTAFRVPAKQLARFNELCNQRKIWIYGGEITRVATHIHTRSSDVDLFYDTLAESRR